jgi:5-methyltetrahydropteroyltriglutamate--homocysteine methyltransferase
MSLLYPADGVDGYSRDEFVRDVVAEAATDIRRCLDAGAHRVQIDFTEGRLALKLDPSGGLLNDFVALNNQVLDQFNDDERARIGVHTCPGGDQDSTHSADVDYAGLLPALFAINAGSFFLQMASEPDRARALGLVRDAAPEGATVFIGVTDPINPHVETVHEVKDQILHAAEYIPVERLGSCDDCGFSPFGDDLSTSRDTAFAKISARVEGTALAAQALES